MRSSARASRPAVADSAAGRPPYKTKTEMAYEHLRDAIIGGRLAPGSRIVAHQVARELGISEIPVREAISRLHSEGFVQSRAHRGVRVAPLNLESLSEVLHMRSVLEGLAARYAARILQPEHLRRLEELNAQMFEAAARRDHRRAHEVNRTFHLEMYRPLGQNRLYKTIVDLYDASVRAWGIFHLAPERIAVSAHEHSEILAALHGRHAETAEWLMRRHKEAAWAVLEDRLRRLNGSLLANEKENDLDEEYEEPPHGEG